MSSPVEVNIGQLLLIDRDKSTAIYLQIVHQFIEAVKAGKLQSGQRLPGSRSISVQLQVHRKTVVAALEELKTQGWLRSVASVGSYVENPEQPYQYLQIPLSLLNAGSTTIRKNYVLDTYAETNEYPYHFTVGTPDYRLVKISVLSRFYTAALRKKSVVKRMAQLQGNPYYKQQLSSYITEILGLAIPEDNLLSVQNKEILLYILGQALLQKGDIVLVAAYSYPFANMVFQQLGATIKTIPTDAEGISIDYIRDHYKSGDIKCIYIQPYHQYPSTQSMSAARREALIALSRAYGCSIIEDGSEAEISFGQDSKRPLLIESQGENILYLGSFGGFLPREFQSAYLIGSATIIHEARKYAQLFGQTDYLKEQAFAEMIATGDIHRFRRKALRVYSKRAQLFNTLITKHFGSSLHYQVPDGGFAFWLQIKQKTSVYRLRIHAGRHGLFIPMGCLYQNKDITALHLGYAHLGEEEMENALILLKKAFDESH